MMVFLLHVKGKLSRSSPENLPMMLLCFSSFVSKILFTYAVNLHEEFHVNVLQGVFFSFLILKITIFACFFQFIFLLHHFINNNFSHSHFLGKRGKILFLWFYFSKLLVHMMAGHLSSTTSRSRRPILNISQRLPIDITVGKITC